MGNINDITNITIVFMRFSLINLSNNSKYKGFLQIFSSKATLIDESSF